MKILGDKHEEGKKNLVGRSRAKEKVGGKRIMIKLL